MRTLIPLALALALSAPAFAQKGPENGPAPQPDKTTISADTPMEELIELASTPEDRARLMLRCAGPPPRRPDHMAQKTEPKSEPPEG